MSASTTVVQCAAVCSDRTMCSPICRRMIESGSPVAGSSSRYGDSMCSGGCDAGASSTNAITSFLVTRPRRPVPGTWARSMPCCSAILRTTGEIGGAWPLPVAGGGACSSTWGSPGVALVSIRASSVPTSTVVPTSTTISETRPLAGDGISVSTLSVEISTTISSASTQSPTRFFHSTTVPSATDTPIWGIVTSAIAPDDLLVGEELTARLLHVVDLRQHGALERRAERDRDIGRCDSDHRPVEVLERALGDERGHLGAHAARPRGLVEHHHLAGLADAREDRLRVERYERAEVEHLHARAIDVLGGLHRRADHRAVRDHRQVGARA